MFLKAVWVLNCTRENSVLYTKTLWIHPVYRCKINTLHKKEVTNWNTVFSSTQASSTPSKNSSSRPDTVQHHSLSGVVKHKHAIYSSLTLSWLYIWEYMFQFSTFHSLLFEATNVWVGETLAKKKKRKCWTCQRIKINLDSSARKTQQTLACVLLVYSHMQSICFLLFISFSDKSLQTKPPPSNKRALVVVGMKWNLSVMSPLFQYAAREPRHEKGKPENVPLVQWWPLSNCRLMHSKQNGKCLSYEM